MEPQVIDNIRFGELTLDLKGRRLFRNGQRVAIGPMEFKLLQTLLTHRESVLSPDEIRILVWSDDPSSGVVPAGDVNALYVSIRKLRSALGDHGKFVVNIPKVGYTISEDAVVKTAAVQKLGPVIDESPFIGRANEVDAIINALTTKTRLITITGPPGIGKTRLALETADRLRDAFQEDVHFVDLKVIDDEDFVPKAVIAALDLPESPGQDEKKEVVTALANKKALVVLDNCEHVIDAVADLVAAVHKVAPSVRIISTSREPLNVPAETVLPLGCLELPPSGNGIQPSDILGFPAVQLFVRLAGQRRPDLAFTSSDARKVAELCRKLEGIPIAIELAAAQVDAYTTEQIIAGMEDRLRLLKRRRGEHSGHETLESAIAWSYDLLSDDERSFFRRLSVFRGGWTADAALKICGEKGQTETDVVHILAGLVRRSLIQLVTSATSQRYVMLEMIRQFGARRLREADEETALLERRTKYFVDLAERSFEDGDRGDWPSIIRAEYDNIRSVLRRTIIDGVDAMSGIRLCGALNRFWFYNGYINEALRWTDLALANDDRSDPAARGRALTAAGFFFGQMPGAKNDSDKRRSYFEESVKIWRTLNDRKNLGVTLIGYSYMLNRMGEYNDAIATAREALETFRETEFHFQAARAANNLALAYLDNGEFDQAKPLIEEALAGARLADDRLLEAICLHNLAELAIQTGNFDEANDLIVTCLDMFRELGQRPLVARTQMLKGELLAILGEVSSAVITQQEALAEFEQMQDNQSIASSLETLANSLVIGGTEFTLAAELLGAARSLRDKLDIRLGPSRKAELERVSDRIKETVGEAAFSKSFDKGQRAPLKSVVAAAQRVSIS